MLTHLNACMSSSLAALLESPDWFEISYLILLKFNRLGAINISLLQSARCTSGGEGTRTGTTAVVGGGGSGAGPNGSAVGLDMLGLDLGLKVLSPALACNITKFELFYKKRN